MTAIDYPPMQDPASFNLDAVKKQDRRNDQGPRRRLVRRLSVDRQDRLVPPRMPAFVGAADADRRLVLEGTDVFANSTAGAKVRIDMRLLDRPLPSLAVHDLRVERVDCLVGDRTVLFADDAVSPVGIGKAARRVEGRQPDPHLLFLFDRKRRDGLGGADLAAKIAVICAIAQPRRPVAASRSLPGRLRRGSVAGRRSDKSSCTVRRRGIAEGTRVRSGLPADESGRDETPGRRTGC